MCPVPESADPARWDPAGLEELRNPVRPMTGQIQVVRDLPPTRPLRAGEPVDLDCLLEAQHWDERHELSFTRIGELVAVGTEEKPLPGHRGRGVLAFPPGLGRRVAKASRRRRAYCPVKELGRTWLGPTHRLLVDDRGRGTISLELISTVWICHLE